MTIPKLNSVPKYELIIPSTQEKVRFRPFLVKEQKVLLMAHESGDKSAIVNSMIDTIDACIEDIDVKKLATFDVDYIFTQIRAKSVGERVELIMRCGECETQNPIVVDLEKIQMNIGSSEKLIEITPDISVKMKFPSYEKVLAGGLLNMESATDIVMELIYTAIEAIQTNDSYILVKDEPKEDLVAFVDSMTSEQFEKLSDFVQEIPTISYTSSFVCSGCQAENDISLKGLDDFF